MVKVGPAFFDSIGKDIRPRKKLGSSGRFSGIVNLIPTFLFALIFLTIVSRLFYIQVLRAEYYRGLSENNRTRVEIIPAPRGVILDRRGKTLAANTAVYKIRDGTGRAKILNQSDALRMIAGGKKVEIDSKREYFYKNSFAHVIGYIGQVTADQLAMPGFEDYGLNDYVGKMGLELEYEKVLHGTNGRRLFEVDSRGHRIRELGTSEPVSGENIKTTLDLDIQKSVSSSFDPAFTGAVVVSDPRNGGILAAYSSPAFDPNVFISKEDLKAAGEYQTVDDILQDNQRRPLLDRAISGAYPPGSTFKLISAAAALEKGSIKPDTQIEDTGILKVGAFSFGNWYFLQYGRTEGSLNIVGAIKRSNDIFFYKTAEQTGVDYISGWARTFGLGSKLNIDLPGETSGIVPTVEWKEKTINEQWYLGDTYNYGIGQGFLLATPLQVNTFTNVFANGGTLFRPHLLDGQVKVLKKDFVKKENIDLIRQGMAEACDTGGVAWPLFQFKVNPPVGKLKIDNSDFFEDASSGAQLIRIKLACKTGTAEVGGDKKPDAWITVFAPFNHPEISVTVLVENGGEGSSVAGPIAKKILTDYFEKK